MMLWAQIVINTTREVGKLHADIFEMKNGRRPGAEESLIANTDRQRFIEMTEFNKFWESVYRSGFEGENGQPLKENSLFYFMEGFFGDHAR